MTTEAIHAAIADYDVAAIKLREAAIRLEAARQEIAQQHKVYGLDIAGLRRLVA